MFTMNKLSDVADSNKTNSNKPLLPEIKLDRNIAPIVKKPTLNLGGLASRIKANDASILKK